MVGNENVEMEIAKKTTSFQIKLRSIQPEHFLLFSCISCFVHLFSLVSSSLMAMRRQNDTIIVFQIYLLAAFQFMWRMSGAPYNCLGQNALITFNVDKRRLCYTLPYLIKM